ncbi:HNH endonuclease signature motif containing protein [Microbacterium sp. SSM24]|uniref:HNH endonuclease signature motif containing protein n=1 Tax=Microbacterium sp. SSM24 TaxID=2991714 RepID=UPI00222744CD|nr:HNH endonuclease signature motif containing protein [Microbacterium sp. SSM24]MCW3492533.1 HNH endonuclease [Microbacterium sp. SSM24]
MDALADTLQQVERLLGDAATGVFDGAGLRAADDPELLGLLAQVAAVSRLVDAVLVGVVGEVVVRADAAPHAERITTVHGCRSVKELVQRVTRQSSRTVAEVLRGAGAVAQPVAPTTGEVLPAAYPAMREALASGAVGVDGLAAVVAALDGAGCAAQARRAAEAELAAAARGAGCDGAPPPGADELRVQAQVWAMFLDQDGAEPRETRALRKRGLTLGVCRDGLVPIRGQLLPEVAGQLETLFHAILNPKGDGPETPTGPHFTVVDTAVDTVVDDAGVPGVPAGWDDREAPFEDQADPRTRVQRQHDAFATILTVAARSAEAPTIGGAAPTLVVSVTEQDLRTGTGHAHLDGCDEPVPLTVARHVACTGTIQRVTSDQTGRIRAIHTIDRVFGPHQRKAITLRDGGCIIPGCHVPAAWCEIHHVHEHAHGGPTHTDNGASCEYALS